MKRIVFALLAIALLATPAWAQFETGTVVGTLKDSTGAVVPAKVTLTNTRRRDQRKDQRPNVVRILHRAAVTMCYAERRLPIALVDNIQVTVGARQRSHDMAVGQF